MFRSLSLLSYLTWALLIESCVAIISNCLGCEYCWFLLPLNNWMLCVCVLDQESSPLLETGSSIADLLLIYKDSSELLGDHEPPTAPGGPSVSSWAHPDATGPSEAPYSVTPAPRQFRESALRIRTTSSPSPPPDYQAFWIPRSAHLISPQAIFSVLLSLFNKLYHLYQIHSLCALISSQ